MAGLSFDRARAKRAVLATCVVAALTTAGLASARGQHRFADADSAKASFPREAMQRWLDTPRWMQTPLMAATRGDGDDKGYGVSSIVPVTTCADDLSAGSLRKVIEGAQDNDIIDLTDLACSTITLAHGELHVTKNGVQIFGPTDHSLTIDGAAASRTLRAETMSSLSIYDLGFANGSVAAEPYLGGCVLGGSLTLARVAISSCKVNASHTSSSPIGGGGIATSSLDATDLIVSNNVVSSAIEMAYGGGVFVDGGNADLALSLVSDNRAESNGSVAGGGIYVRNGGAASFWMAQLQRNIAHSFGNRAYGGGALAVGIQVEAGSTVAGNSVISDADDALGGGLIGSDISVSFSSVSANVAKSGTSAQSTVIGGGISTWVSLNAYSALFDGNKVECTNASVTSNCEAIGGGVASYGNNGDDLNLVNVTISGNSAEAHDKALAGGIFVGNDKALFAMNSTIAFNRSSSTNQSYGGGGLVATSPQSNDSVLINTIVSNNDTATGPNDFATVAGSHLYLQAFNDLFMSLGDGVVGLSLAGLADPNLGPLADNGGLTKTHAIDNQSAAFNTGVAVGGLTPKCDQRGAGFSRIVGANPDIGAYEVQDALHGDQVFFDGFNPKGTDECNF